LQLRLKSLLRCRDTIVNGPFPDVNLWRASTHYLLANLERPGTNAIPGTVEYSSFRLPPPHSAPLLSESNDIDPEDDAEVRNELSALDGLIKISPEPDEPGIAGANDPVDSHLPTDTARRPANTLDPEVPPSSLNNVPEAWPDGTMDLAGNVETVSEPAPHLVPPAGGIWRNGPGDVGGSSSNGNIEEKFWNENPRPQSLPPISTIFDAIHSPSESSQQQKPTKIWKEIMNLYLPQETGRVRISLATPSLIPLMLH
jgi:hypothetical protein